jgi:NAD(P)-dependent dehydrogenase (short-subunit alcohol dehydrogenase family)
MVVFGSTVTTWSAYSLCLRAKKAGAKLIVVGRGQSRADDIVDLRIAGGLSELSRSIAFEVCDIDVDNVLTDRRQTKPEAEVDKVLETV